MGMFEVGECACCVGLPCMVFLPKSRTRGSGILSFLLVLCTNWLCYLQMHSFPFNTNLWFPTQTNTPQLPPKTAADHHHKMLMHCGIWHSTTQLAGSFTELVRSLQILHQQPCRFSSSSAAGEGGKDSSSSTSDGGGGQGICAASCCLPTALLSCIVKQHQFTHTLLLVCR